MRDYSPESVEKKRKRSKSRKRKAKNKAGILIFRVITAVFLIVGFAGAGAVLGAYIAVIRETPANFDMYFIEPNKYATVIVNEQGEETGRFRGEENREYVAFADIPQNLKNAFVAVEDERFYKHNGIDVKGIARSVYVLLTKHDVQGASTITQQVIKVNVTKPKDSRNTLELKLREQYLAVKYEDFLTQKLNSKKAAKDYILGVYMNSIPMAHGLYGVQTSAGYYFGKDVGELDLAECAVIASITNNPVKYAPDTNAENNKQRALKILKNMLDQGYISRSQYEQAAAEDVYASVGANRDLMRERPAWHTFYEDSILESVLDGLIAKGYDKTAATSLIYDGGLKIVSAQDAELQKIVDEEYADDDNFPKKNFEWDVTYIASIKNDATGETRNIERNSGRDEAHIKTDEEAEEYISKSREEAAGPGEEISAERTLKVPEPQSAFVLLDYHTGEIKAVAGGRGEKTTDRAFNRAVDATRSPGSVFKVLASYAPAIDLGLITPATVIDDVPSTFGKYTPKNWYGGYRGLVTVRQGITNSLNVITVKNMNNTGVDRCFDYLLNFGFTTLTDSDRGLSTALGGLTNGVTQVELAAAYGAIANGGMYNKPVFYTKVYDHDGNILLDNSTVEPRQVVKATSAYLLTDMMEGTLTDAGATGGRARFKNVKMPIAGKTGTTSDTKDLVFAGYTPYYAATVWLGYDHQKNLQASGEHMTLWSKIMERAHENLPYKDFPKPDGIVSASVCRYSGKLPVAGICDHDPRGNAIRTEIFAAGTVPTQSCDVHAAVVYDSSTGQLANEYCPPSVRETRVGIVRRSGAGQAADSQYEVNPNGPQCSFHNQFNSHIIPSGGGSTPSDLPTDLGDTQQPSDLGVGEIIPPDLR